jgi:hypothetical protein
MKSASRLFHYTDIFKMLSDCHSLSTYSSFYVAQQPKLDVGRLIVEVSRSLSDTQTVLVFWTSDYPLAEAAAHHTQNTHTKETNMPTLSGIRIRYRDNQAASDLPLSPHGHSGRQ